MFSRNENSLLEGERDERERQKAGQRGWREECEGAALVAGMEGKLSLVQRLLRHRIELHPQLDKASELLSLKKHYLKWRLNNP